MNSVKIDEEIFVPMNALVESVRTSFTIMAIDRTHLQSILDEFRSSIEPCWSEETAYVVPETSKYGPYIPSGQCAVTCLILIDVLRDRFPDEQIVLASGLVESSGGEILIGDHAWVRIGEGDDAIIVDPTADQAASIVEKVIVGTKREIEAKGIRYIEREIESDHGESNHPNRLKRYVMLREAWRGNR